MSARPAALAPPNRAQRRAQKKAGSRIAREGLQTVTPELLIGRELGEEIDYEAARETTEARLIREFLQLNVDPRYDVIFAKPGAVHLRGGYWHIIFRNDSGVPNIWEVCSLDGRGDPCAPTMAHVNRIRDTDLNHRNVWDDYKREQAAARRRKEKDAEAKHEEFREKLLERLTHLYGVTVAIPAHVKDRMEREAATLEQAGGAALPEPSDGGETAGEVAAPPTTATAGGDAPTAATGPQSVPGDSTPVNGANS